MKYACLVYVDGTAMAALSPAEGKKLTDDSIDFDWEVEKSGRLIMAQPLESPDKAVTVRVRQGKLSSTDGPFIETKEFLAGFFLIEARDLDEAIEVAGQSPMAAVGSIEVRAFFDQTHSVTGAPRPRAGSH